MNYWLYIPGILMILFGLLIAIMPEILVVLVSTFFIITGISALGIARTLSGGTGPGSSFTIRRF